MDCTTQINTGELIYSIIRKEKVDSSIPSSGTKNTNKINKLTRPPQTGFVFLWVAVAQLAHFLRRDCPWVCA
jgi:hypothetical protein